MLEYRYGLFLLSRRHFENQIADTELGSTILTPP